MQNLIDIFLHQDKYLNQVIGTYHQLAYALLFLIIFLETGLVVTPFLPGDSLLFAAGAIAAVGTSLHVPVLLILFCIASIAGDTVNYHIGKALSGRVRRRERIPLVMIEYIDRTQAFFGRHGGKTITLARFVPIIRTFAPFVAGVGSMPYRRFLGFNIIGGVCWVVSIFTIGYLFGNIAWIKDHFSVIVIAIVVISVLPMAFGWLRARHRQMKEQVNSL